jgi:CubicO group peptidase (beta-lactamase class C family)
MSLPTAAPADVGLDARRLAVADGHIRAGQDEKVYPAAVLLVARHGQIAHHRAFGHLHDGGKPTRPDTIFDLASVTKPCVATGLLTLVEDGKVSLAQTVEDFLPEAKGTPIGPLTIRQLATHTTGLPPWKPLYKHGQGREAQLAEILRTPLRSPPGTHYAYSDLGYILLGEIVARAGGMNLDQYLHARLFAPLGMKDTGYLPAATRRSRIAPTANCPMRPDRTLIGEVHDANAHASGGVSGHAGLFGTAPDLALLATALAGKGEANLYRVLGIPALRLAQTNQIAPDIGGHSIGWFTPPNGMLPRGDLLGDTAFGHTGFTGTMIVCDPVYDLVAILLTNRVMNPDDNGVILRVRRRVMNAVASAIVR